MSKVILRSALVAIFSFAVNPAWALDPNLPPGSNFDLSHWDLQLPTINGVLTGGSGNVDTLSPSQLTAGATNAYFYTGPDGAMIFWAPDDGARTGNSSHPRSEFRELLNPNNGNLNWTLNGTHVLTATCVVSNVPSDTENVCIGQIHEPNNKPDGSVSANNEQMILFNLSSKQIYAHIEIDGNTNTSFDQTLLSGASNVALGKPINYTMSVVDGLLTIIVNNVTNSWNLYGGTNFQGKIFTNWGPATGNTFYFKAGDYNQTDDACGCSTDGSLVAFYSLTLYHAPSITNQPDSLAVNVGSNATFTVGADGNGILSYQWLFNATNSLTGATNASLIVTNVSGANAGNYTVVVSDSTSSFSSITSAVATLTAIYPHTTVTFTNPGTTTWICPVGVSLVQVECWGGGGAGGSALRTPNMNNIQYGGGGAGGAYARLNSYPVISGNTYYVNVGTGGVAATGTLTNDVKMPGGDSWFNSVSSEPVSAGNCLAKGGDGGECAVGNTTATAYGAGGVGTTNGSIGDVLFAGGNGGVLTSSSGFGGSGGGSGGTGSNGNSGGTNGLATTAVTGGGSGGAPNASSGNSGPGQTPTIPPGGGGGGVRASTQETGGNGAVGQVVLTYSYNSPIEPVISTQNMSADRSTFTLTGTGSTNQAYMLLTTANLTPPVTWTPLVTNNADVNGVFNFTDTQVTNFPQRFYRVATP